ncbi:PspC domain-containing protein [Tersicoccus sp. MR15.9]|uniref:PspC domain-containing protein n=1 Tax=Tersicoccus mangrovi TaxID=3121635 RepID=UPI002FE5442F
MNSFFTAIRSLGVRRGPHRMLAGVCGGIADRFGVSPWLVRLIFVLSLLLPGSGIVVYLIAWVLLPDEQGVIPLQRSLQR